MTNEFTDWLIVDGLSLFLLNFFIINYSFWL